MQLGMIGLGRMGTGMTERLREGGHEVQTYDPRVESTADTLEELVRQLEPLVARAHETGCVVTKGLGPRYLHSTGQLHKGGPNTGLFLQVVDDVGEERRTGTEDLNSLFLGVIVRF